MEQHAYAIAGELELVLQDALEGPGFIGPYVCCRGEGRVVLHGLGRVVAQTGKHLFLRDGDT